MLVVLQFLPQCRLAGNTSLSRRRFYKDWSVTTFVDCRFPSIHPHLITNHRYVTRSQCCVVIMLPTEKRRLITTDLVNLSASIKNIRHGVGRKLPVCYPKCCDRFSKQITKSIPVFTIGIFCLERMIDHFDMTIKAPDINTNRLLSN